MWDKLKKMDPCVLKHSRKVDAFDLNAYEPLNLNPQNRNNILYMLRRFWKTNSLVFIKQKFWKSAKENPWLKLVLVFETDYIAHSEQVTYI